MALKKIPYKSILFLLILCPSFLFGLDEETKSTFYKECCCGRVEVVKSFLQAKVNPNFLAENHVHPLLGAIHYEHPIVVEILLKAKADPNLTSMIEFAPICMAAYKRNLKLTKLLLKYGARDTIEAVSYTDNDEIIDALIQQSPIPIIKLAQTFPKEIILIISEYFDHRPFTQTKKIYCPKGTALAMGNNKENLFTIHSNRKVYKWSLYLSTLPGVSFLVEKPISTSIIDKKNERFIFGHYDGTITLRNPYTLSPVASLMGHTNEVTSLSLHPSGDWLLSGSKDKTIRVWNLKTRQQFSSEARMFPISALSFNPDGKHYDSLMKEPSYDQMDSGNTIAYSPDSHYRVAGYDSGKIEIYNQRTRKETVIYMSSPGVRSLAPITSVAVSPDSKLLVVGNEQGQLAIFDLLSLERLQIYQLSKATIKDLLITPNGNDIVSLDEEGIKVIRVASKRNHVLEILSLPRD